MSARTHECRLVDHVDGVQHFRCKMFPQHGISQLQPRPSCARGVKTNTSTAQCSLEVGCSRSRDSRGERTKSSRHLAPWKHGAGGAKQGRWAQSEERAGCGL